jgi:hypothetical protein
MEVSIDNKSKPLSDTNINLHHRDYDLSYSNICVSDAQKRFITSFPGFPVTAPVFSLRALNSLVDIIQTSYDELTMKLRKWVP